MSANFNQVTIIGNLTRDPEVKFTPKGMAVLTISLAVNRAYKVGEEKREEVTYIDIEFWGKQAEIIGEYAKKGRPLFVQGRLAVDSWTDKATDQKRTRMKVVGETFQFLGSAPQGSQNARPAEQGSGYNRPQNQRPATAASHTPADEDDIPF